MIIVKKPEIPGVLTHPLKYFFIKYFCLGYDRGAEITVLPVKVRKINLQKWLTKHKKHPNSK